MATDKKPVETADDETLDNSKAPGMTPAFGMEQLATMIGSSVAQAIESQSPKKIPYGKYEPRTPWQPTKAGAHKLTRPCYQNGIGADEQKMTNVEIDLWNRLTHSGRYLNRLVEVAFIEDGSVTHVNLRYNNKTPDQRMLLKDEARNLTEMLTLIVAEQELEDAESADADDRKQTARRKFGDTKASREARAAANV